MSIVEARSLVPQVAASHCLTPCGSGL